MSVTDKATSAGYTPPEVDAKAGTDDTFDSNQAPPRAEIRIRLPQMPRATVVAAAVAGVVVAVMAGTLAHEIRGLRTRVDSLESRARRDTTAVSRMLRRFEIESVIGTYSPTVDLHSANLAEIGNGFSAGNLELSAVPGGTQVTGTIVNSQAVSHEGATFELTADGHASSFSVMNLPAGGSSRFKVIVTGVQADSVRWGQFKYQNSTISYRRPLGVP